MRGKICQIDLNDLKNDLKSIQGIKKVYDLHVWSLSHQSLYLSCHAICSDPQNAFSLVRELLNQKYNIPFNLFLI